MALLPHLEDGVGAAPHYRAELRRVLVVGGLLPLRSPSLRYGVADQAVEDAVQQVDECPVTEEELSYTYSMI